MGPRLLLLFIVGDILGTGVYALTGQVTAEVGGAARLPFIVAFGVAVLTAFSLIEISGLVLVVLIGFYAIGGGDADLSRVIAFDTPNDKNVFVAITTATSWLSSRRSASRIP